MVENDSFLTGQILYNLRNKYYNSAIQTINQAIRTHGNSPTLKYFYCLALILQERIHEAVKDLDFLKTNETVGVGALLALIHVHKKFASVDRETLIDIDAKLKETRKQADEKALYFGGYFWYIVGRADKAREYIDRGIKMNDASVECLNAKGWIEISSDVKLAYQYFEKALSINSKYTDASFGLAKCREMQNSFSPALDTINRILVANPNYLCAVIEKMKLQLSSQDWDQCLEVAQRALTIDESCMEALRYQILELLCRDGRYQEAAESISHLYNLMERSEPNSHFLYFDYSRVFARVCGKSTLVLSRTERFLEKAITLDQNNSSYLVELGLQQLAQDKIKEATKCYLSALKLDKENISALIGKLRCQIAEDDLQAADQELELISAMQSNSNILYAEIPYLRAILAKKRQSTDKNSKLIDEAIQCHFKNLKGLPLGKEYFFNLNPDFILELVIEYLSFAPSSPIEPGQTPDPIFKKCSNILDPLTKAVPGLIPAIYYLGKVKYLAGENDVAKASLQKIIDKEPSYSQAYILMAQINLKQKDFKSANQMLEFGLSYNFKIKNHPTYHLIKARIQKSQNQVDEAIKTLLLTMQLPGVKKASKSTSEISLQDRAVVFLELADCYLINNLQHEAIKIMQEAINEFRGTLEETRITVANVDLSLNRNDIDGALSMLKKIEPSQPYYVEAREKMAHIYLKHRKDKKMYLATYKELAEKSQTTHTLSILGDAYMNIIEPDKAVEAYESALRKNPKDSGLAKKIGQALVKAHCYIKAINYYETALKTGQQKLLRYDLAQLYFRLNQLDKAEKQISQAVNEESNDLENVAMIGKCCYLMSEICEKQNSMETATQWLEKARDVYMRAIKRAKIEDPVSVGEHKNWLSTILKKFAQHFTNINEISSVEKMYKDAIINNDSDEEAKLLLADFYLKTDNLDLCQQLCTAMEKATSEPSVELNLMLANLMFRRGETPQAIFYFKNVFSQKPDHYEALVTLTKLLYRAGNIDETQSFIDTIEKQIPRATNEAGFNFAKGLFYQLSCKPIEALKFYNKCRGDKRFGAQACIEMANVCLNPENEIRSDEDWKKKSATQKNDSAKTTQETAVFLLKGASSISNDVRYKITENYCLIHTGEKNNVEKAIENLYNLEAKLKDHVGIARAIAECFLILKQPPKARNHLKRMATRTWNTEDADDIEKCWLLLATTYMSAGKFDQALELCKKCTDYNKSCTRAYEFIGQMMEREAAYKDAADNYERAWSYGKKNQPAIGYKLAFNYMKAKRYTDAIDICHYVIEKFPEFPKIKKDILEKARQLIRT